MALGDPVQWIIIGVIVVVIFLWGPNKIPELARSIGNARREFEQAKGEIQNPSASPPVTAAPSYVPAPAEKSGDDILISTARSLGITTEGKTREQISQEIISRR